MKLRYIAYPAILLGGWFGYFTLANVNTEDIVAYNKLEKHVGSTAFRAGDLVEVSADGTSIIGSICVTELPADAVQDTRLNKVYVNGLSQSLPQFAALIGWAKSLVLGGDDTEAQLNAHFAAVSFTGSMSELATAQPQMSQDCTCAVAETIIRRQKVCTVQRAMIEEKLRPVSPLDPNSGMEVSARTVGVTFRPYAQMITDLKALNCPGLNTDTIIPSTVQQCSAGAEWSTDVMLREKLRVIREEDVMGPHLVAED